METVYPMASISDVAKTVKRAEVTDPTVTYRQIGVRLWGKGAYEREAISGAETRYKKLFRVEKDDIIVNKIWARNGSVAVVPPKLAGCYGSSEFPTFEPDRHKLEPRWFHWVTKTSFFWQQCDEESHGTSGKNRIRPERFLEIEIPLPSLDEQRRIVTRIEELAALIEEARGLRVKAREDAEVLAKVASKASFERLDVSEEQWVSLDSVTDRITKGESPGWQGFGYVENGPLFIRSQNVLWGQLDPSSAKRIPPEFHDKLSRSQLHSGDVLINLVGASIGRSTVVPDNLSEANVNQAVAVITPQEELDPRFLMLFLISPFAQRILHGGKVETARPNISLTDLRNLRVPVPSLDEQRRIVAYLDALQAQVDQLTALQDATQAELEALMPSVLDRAFRGELRASELTGRNW